MKLEEIVLSIEQAKYLQRHGVDMSDAALCWEEHVNFSKLEMLNNSHPKDANIVPTYTLQELMRKFPRSIEAMTGDYSLELSYELPYVCRYYRIAEDGEEESIASFYTGDELYSAFLMAHWLVAGGYLKEEKK